MEVLVFILDRENNLVSTIEVDRYLGVGILVHTHPHDVIVLSNDDLAVAIWKGQEQGSVWGFEFWSLIRED